MRALLAPLLAAVLAAGCGPVYRRVGGDFAGPPSEMRAHLSPGALARVDHAMDGIDPERFADLHVHLLGTGEGGTGAWVHPSMQSLLHPIRRARTAVYLSAAGVAPGAEVDRRYVERLAELIRSIPGHGRYHLLAFDRVYDRDGTAVEDRTPFYTPNHWVFEVADTHPDLFVPVVSIHPYRADALRALEVSAARGARFVKWLPNVMGVDPSDAALEPYYARMASLDLVLLSHTGFETAVEHASQSFGNPLLLRRPLEAGVRVVALHAASLGRYPDLDDASRPEVLGFDLMLRMLDDPRYRGLLYAEISATTARNQPREPLRRLIARSDLHPRIVNGSDYPLPGIRVIDATGDLADEGALTETEARELREIYAYNPLLFDLLVKRTVRDPETGRSLPASVFMLPDGLAPPEAARPSPGSGDG